MYPTWIELCWLQECWLQLLSLYSWSRFTWPFAKVTPTVCNQANDWLDIDDTEGSEVVGCPAPGVNRVVSWGNRGYNQGNSRACGHYIPTYTHTHTETLTYPPTHKYSTHSHIHTPTYPPTHTHRLTQVHTHIQTHSTHPHT